MESKKNNVIIFFCFFIITFLCYYPSQNAKFVNDTLYYLNEIEQNGWKGIFNSYHMIFLWHVPSIAYYIVYKIFGFHWLGWHLVFSFLHSINAFLLFIIIQKVIKKETNWTSFFASLLFLVSPYQTEVVAWGAALHYILIVNFLLLGFLVLIRYFETNSIKYLIWFHLFFLGSLSCFEQAFLFPLLFALFVALIIPIIVDIDVWKLMKIFFLKFFLLNMVSILGYFIMTKIVFGVWIAHYGSGTHASIHLKSMLDSLLNYNLKFLVYYRYLPSFIQQYINNPIFHLALLIISVFIVIAFICWILLKKYYHNYSIKIITFFLSCYVVMLVPVLNLDNSFTFEIQSDRYGYIASLFFYPLFVWIAFKVLDRLLFIMVMLAEIVICIILLTHAVQFWHSSGNFALSLIDNYPLRSGQNAYVLNLPDNYRGAYMFRNGFAEGLSLLHKSKNKFNTEIIAWVNVFSNENETSIEIINDSTYYVKCLKEGKWYYYKGAGATDYETQQYKVDFDEWNFAYQLTIKNKPKDTTYILQCDGNKWKTIDTLIP